MLNDNRAEVAAAFADLPPQRKIDYFIKLLPYVIPKQQYISGDLYAEPGRDENDALAEAVLSKIPDEIFEPFMDCYLGLIEQAKQPLNK